MITINNTKAIEVAKDKIRVVRNEQLAKQDVEFQKALETGSDTAPIVAEKQRLRDLPAQADGKTVEELKTLLNEIGA